MSKMSLRPGRNVLTQGISLFGLLFLVFNGVSCAQAIQLRDDVSIIEQKISTARARGAYNCAPKELAMAESNWEFLIYELDEGDFLRAARHQEIALKNIDRALEVTDPLRCMDPSARDSDGDGILDGVDQCPDEPEDKDGFADEDGCPDPDNDADTVLDVEDKCPNDAGPPSNGGCPIDDRDGDGILDDRDQCPDIPEDIDGIDDFDGCPEQEDLDSDGDGLLDKDDKCPDDPEDFDEFEDDDGCPELDNDKDNVPDLMDACPLQAGPEENGGCPNADRDGDGINDDLDQCPDVPGPAPRGCPKRILVEKTETAIVIKEKINFEFGKAAIKGRLSFMILDQVGAVMKSNPKITIRIEGHTDSKGSAAYNLRLSDDRANSVMAALRERGVENERMNAIGYGETKPIANNQSNRGRAENRRVEFNIVQATEP